jgi:hypothetical protein
VVIGKRSQRIILILSAAIPGQCGLCTFFKRSAHRGERLICLPPVIVMVNMARGPPFFFGQSVCSKAHRSPRKCRLLYGLGKEV